MHYPQFGSMAPTPLVGHTKVQAQRQEMENDNFSSFAKQNHLFHEQNERRKKERNGRK